MDPVFRVAHVDGGGSGVAGRGLIGAGSALGFVGAEVGLAVGVVGGRVGGDGVGNVGMVKAILAADILGRGWGGYSFKIVDK